MKRALVLTVVMVAVAAWAAPAAAQNTVTIYITNLSRQIISPPVVASHTWKVAIFVPGQPASMDLAALAEDGDGSGLVDLLSGHDEVLDVAAAGGPILPGETAVLELEVRGKFNRISAVGMLVTTNDAFFGLSNFLLDPSRAVQRVMAPAWDAGTEVNNEMCEFIPGPPCGNPFMRDTDGLDVCRELRKREDYVPILMLTARSGEVDRILGFELGADDYLTKPFSVRELVARVKAILRRADRMAADQAAPAVEPIVIDDLSINREKRRVLVKGEPIELTAKEYDLLVHFAGHPGRVYTRGQILDQVWGYGEGTYEHTVNSHINRLRAKIETDPSQPRFIQTVWGVGYRFFDPSIATG